ncbi:PRDM5 [Mytilus coruscus]|uniref:PRDM5 n=1 Tax=Mytilus coruscus TaxID=42192 RepID=A0A6J8EJP8_MYTCO|nr:PRDM5 [Mytilus coruscus]
MSKEMVSQLEVSAMIQRIKQEPQDEEFINNKQCNGLTKEATSKRKSTEDITATGQTGLKRFRNQSENGKPSIPCLICDRYLENQDELMIHMALDHQCSQQGSRRQVGRIPKHTCQICFAKFRTLRDLFTHTTFHAKQLQLNGEWASEIGNRMEKNIMKQGAIRQYFSNLQNNLNGDIQHGTFKCDCCHNIFMNRDTYAMHVMMRVKDETCKPDDMYLKKSSVKENGSEYGEKIDLVPSQSGQEFLIDVTSSVNEDEYLKSALSVADSNQRTPREESKFQSLQGIKCMCCSEHFLDQDAMAMHVMTVHAATKKQQMTSLNHPKESAAGQQNRKGKKSQDQSNDITVHEFFRCQFCGSIFESRDVLTMHVLTQHAKENENSKTKSNEKENKDAKT